MSNEYKSLHGKQIHLKLGSMPKSLLCKVTNVEPSGLWVSGSPILEAVVQSGATGLSAPNPVIFVPFHNIHWILAAAE